MGKQKHIPIRTCVACRSTDQKRGLMRVVRQADGTVLYDPKGKLAGRGAYVCAKVECVAIAQKRRQLERSLKVAAVPAELFAALAAHADDRAALDSGGSAPVAEEGEARPRPSACGGAMPRKTEPTSGSVDAQPASEHEIQGETI